MTVSKDIPTRTIHVNGIGGKLCTLSLAPTSTVTDVKAAIEQTIDVPQEDQVLLSGTQELLENEVITQVLPNDQNSAGLTLIRHHPAEAALLKLLGITDARNSAVAQAKGGENSTRRDPRYSMLGMAVEVMRSVAAAAAIHGFAHRANDRTVPWEQEKWGDTRPDSFKDKDRYTGQPGFLLVPGAQVVHAHCCVKVTLAAGLNKILEHSTVQYDEEFHERCPQGLTLADLYSIKSTFPGPKAKHYVEKAVKAEMPAAAMLTATLNLQSYSLEEVVFNLTYCVYGFDGDLLGVL